MDEKKVALADRLMRDRDVPISEVCEAVGISRATPYRYLKTDGSPREENGEKSRPHSGGAEDGPFPRPTTFVREGFVKGRYRNSIH